MKTIVWALALSMVASTADAQFSPLPGFIPYEVNAPAAAAGANQMGEGPCVWTPRGRGGIHSTCEGQNPSEQRR
jgi:hypothetical protein